jgi:predicted metal-dependent phosphoesterase TrpH
VKFARGSQFVCAAALLLTGTLQAAWWKGNLHTHTFWSDGDDFPEAVAAWYKTNGYHFLALSDHNIFQEGEKWITITNSTRGRAFGKYKERFGENWVHQRTLLETQMVRLKRFEEFHALFDEPDRFLLIPGEEISAKFRTHPIHVNAINIREVIKAQEGSNVVEVLQRNVNAVLEQRRRTGQPMFPHINHPNFGWGLTAEDLMRIEGDKFFEVYNGHPAVNNEGDLYHPNTERIWDIVLTFRLAELGLEPMFGTAVDDAHNYHVMARSNSNPGRGWVVVRSEKLTAPAIIAAMERGDFYASSGARLRDIRVTTNALAIDIEGEPGVTYTTQFVGTRTSFDRTAESGQRPTGTVAPVTRYYSGDIGTVLAEVPGLQPVYTFRGDEIYVRAKVVSSKAKRNPYAAGELEVAWTQPVIPGVLPGPAK